MSDALQPPSAVHASHRRARRARVPGLLTGVAADVLVPDPRRWHPVAAFGQAAAALERVTYTDSRPRGAAYAGACVLAAAGAGLLVQRAAASRAGTSAAATGVAAWVTLGGTSLGREASHLARALEAGDTAAARARLPHLCARDPAGLDNSGLARATVESVAENTADAVVAPLLWGAAAGVPGLLAYRAINTLDAMVGYRSPRYERFGWAAARLDDAANWIPARLTGVLAAAGARSVSGSPRVAWRVLRRDGGHHPSPNAGRAEAAFAGALGVRLGGANTYGGRAELRPELGEGRQPEPADIRRAVRLSRTVTAAATVVAVALAVLPSGALRKVWRMRARQSPSVRLLTRGERKRRR